MTAKSQTPSTHSGGSGGGFFGIGLVLMIVVLAGALYYVRRAPAHVAAPPASATAASSQLAAASQASQAPAADSTGESDVPPDVAAGTSIGEDEWPADLPPLPLGSYEVTQPVGQIRAAYKFAAEHPEVENYVPCFCGCELGGHTSNESCFVASRDANGHVTGWDPHGMT